MSSQTKNRLGKRVVGEEEFARTQAEADATTGGQHVLGPRVTGLLNTVPSTQRQLQNANKLGVRVRNDENEDADLSVEELQNVLEENPTHFDSLYVKELHRPEGPRVAALRVFGVVESGIKGEGRPYVMTEINTLLGVPGFGEPSDAFARAEMKAKKQAYEEQQQRMDVNAKLPLAKTAKTLKDMNENLEALKDGDTDLSTHQRPASTERQVAEIMDENGDGIDDRAQGPMDGVDTAGADDEGRGEHMDLAVDDVKPETQSDAPRSSQKPAAKTAAKKATAKKSARKSSSRSR